MNISLAVVKNFSLHVSVAYLLLITSLMYLIVIVNYM